VRSCGSQHFDTDLARVFSLVRSSQTDDSAIAQTHWPMAFASNFDKASSACPCIAAVQSAWALDNLNKNIYLLLVRSV